MLSAICWVIPAPELFWESFFSESLSVFSDASVSCNADAVIFVIPATGASVAKTALGDAVKTTVAAIQHAAILSVLRFIFMIIFPPILMYLLYI
jgi:hypothetical protein